jgi:hypothetical protein
MCEKLEQNKALPSVLKVLNIKDNNLKNNKFYQREISILRYLKLL